MKFKGTLKAPRIDLTGYRAALHERFSEAIVEAAQELLRRHERTGRPLGGERFSDNLERIVGRKPRPQKPGRPRTNEN